MSEAKTILVVDDEPDVVRYLNALFTDAGYEVLEALDGVQAVKLARETHPDLITLDITMPEESGLRAYRELVEDPATRDIPVVVVTGVSPEFKRYLERKQTRVPPPAGYFEKPVDRERLLEVVGELVAG